MSPSPRAAISAVIVVATAYGVGSFVGKTDNQSFLLVEGFVAVITATGLLMIAVRAQQQAAESALEAYNRTLEQRVAERTAEVAEKNRLLEEKQQRLDEDLVVVARTRSGGDPADRFRYDSAIKTPTSLRPCVRPMKWRAISTTCSASATNDSASSSAMCPAKASPRRSAWR